MPKDSSFFVRQVLPFVGLGLLGSFLVMARAIWPRIRGADPPLRIVNRAPVDRADLERLRSRALAHPVEGMKADALVDTFADARGGRPHQALDILAPRGTRVRAVDDGRVVRLFDSRRGGLSVYQFDPTGTFCYLYAHLDGYAPGLEEGQPLRKGALVGFVGTTGNALPDTPHLHFAVKRLGPERRWWEGTPVNPYPVWAFPE